MFGFPPRRMREETAAFYMGVAVSTFRSRVAEGVYPAGYKEIGCVFWLKDQLDTYIDQQFDIGGGHDAGEWEKRFASA